MSRQWMFVGAITGGLILGAGALVKFGTIPEGAEVGQRAPDFEAVNVASGDPVNFHDAYAGNVTLVNIWATWCLPCRAEMPDMQELYDAFKDYGFRIAAVSVDEGSSNTVAAFANDLKLTFDILHDQDGAIQRRYLTTGVPESFLIDRNGVIVRKQLGEHPWSSPANRRIVSQLLGIDPDQAPINPKSTPTVSEAELKGSGG